MGTTASSREGSGENGDRDGGDSGSNFSLITGASPLVLAAPPPLPLQEVRSIHRGLWRVECGLELGDGGESIVLMTPPGEGASQGCRGEAGIGQLTSTFEELAWEKVRRTNGSACNNAAMHFSSKEEWSLLAVKHRKSGSGSAEFKSPFSYSLAVQAQEGHSASLSLSLEAVRWG